MSCAGVLLAVSDVLVIKALEATGKRLVRADRSRFRVLGSTPFHAAHTIWEADDAEVSKALRGAWDVVPVIIATHGGHCGVDPRAVTQVLDQYVHDLCITGTPHTLAELAYRFDTRLALPRDDAEPMLAVDTLPYGLVHEVAR